MKYLALAAVTAALISGCTSSNKAQASGVTVLELTSPSGARCFVIQQDGRAVGGNCL